MSAWLIWSLVGLAALPALVIASLWSTGRFAKLQRGAPSLALPVGEDAALDALLAPFEDAHPRHSGAALVADPTEALKVRLAMAQLAERSLDLLYYIWHDDMTGRLLARAVLEAADRGVRVRMLLDDVNVLNHDPVYRALDRHPRIEVRLFNPIRNRDRGFRRGLEILFNLLPLNRRMHGKLWIADGRLAMTGGRNIGDPYFGAAHGTRVDVDDLDILLSGPVLRSAETLFDAFWNSGVALPLRTLLPGTKTRLGRFRSRLARFFNTPSIKDRVRRLELHRPEEAGTVLALERLHWVRHLEFLGDPPDKALGTSRDGWMPQALLPMLSETRQSLRLMTPYFVPGRDGLAALVARAKAGVVVDVTTNGLGLSDNVLVYGAYRWYRARLLAAGIRIHEVAARAEPRRMLHAKAMIADERRGFVGSFNFDLRSAFLNTEIGVIFDDPVLLEHLRAIMDAARAPDAAYAVAMDGRLPIWSRGDEPGTHHEPESTRIKRAVSFVIGHLPIHRFL
jgi:cardiolipin synthase C